MGLGQVITFQSQPDFGRVEARHNKETISQRLRQTIDLLVMKRRRRMRVSGIDQNWIQATLEKLFVFLELYRRKSL